MGRVLVGTGPKAQTPVMPVLLLVRAHCQHTEQMQLGAEAGERLPSRTVPQAKTQMLVWDMLMVWEEIFSTFSFLNYF